MSRYVFANPEHSVIRRLSDGAPFEIERHQNPANAHGAIAERWRMEGCSTPAPYKAPFKAAEPLKPAVTPDDHARARRRAAGEDRRITR